MIPPYRVLPYYGGFGFGGLGLGLFYDPFWSSYAYGAYGYGAGYGYGYGYPGYQYGYGSPYPYGASPYYSPGADQDPSAGLSFSQPSVQASAPATNGDVRLQVQPNTAQVYVDGLFVGTVEDLNDSGLSIAEGPHHIEFRQSGYETLAVDLKIDAKRTITYGNNLKPAESSPRQ